MGKLMGKIAVLVVLAGAVIAQASVVHAATEVVRLPANNAFAVAVLNDPETNNTTFVFVSRVIEGTGPAVSSMFFVTTTPEGETISGSAVLPQSAFQVSSTTASLDVDLNEITVDNLVGEIPENGVISIDWATVGVQRTAGNVKFDMENGQALIVGVRTDAPAEVSGTIFGAPLVGDDTNSNISVVRSAVIIITRN